MNVALPRYRSWLFVPGNRPDRFAKAFASGADVVIVDLEDAVPAADKARARDAAIGEIVNPRPGAQLALRLNAMTTTAMLADFQALASCPAFCPFLVIPKVEAAATLQILDAWLTETGHASRLVALIESVRGLQSLDAISHATPRLAGLLFGAADMAADLGAACAWMPLLYARSKLVAASAASLLAIDSPFFDIKDANGLRAEAEQAAALGFVAKAAIHPCQLGDIEKSFTPGPAEIAEAKQILVASRHGVGQVNGKMVDEAMARRARRVLQAAGVLF